MVPRLEIQVLGGCRLAHRGQEDAASVRFDAGRLQSLLAYLVLHSRAPQSRQHVAFLFWPDTTEAQAHTNLRNLLHRLRRVLPEADTFLWSDTTLVQWRPDAPFTCDALDFEAAVDAAESHLRNGERQAPRPRCVAPSAFIRAISCPAITTSGCYPCGNGFASAPCALWKCSPGSWKSSKTGRRPSAMSRRGSV